MKTLITSGQQEQVVRTIVDATRKRAETIVAELTKNGAINTSNFQRVLAQGGVLAKAVAVTVKGKMVELAEQIVGYLRLISLGKSIVIGATDGRGMIAKAKDTFPVYIDLGFVKYGTNVKGQPTKKMLVQVFEIIKDGTLAQIFGGFGENLDRLCLSQDQIIRFVKEHSKWLRTDGYGTFFLFKVDNEFFLACVAWDEGRLGVCASRLSFGRVWDAGFRHRIVVPQL